MSYFWIEANLDYTKKEKNDRCDEISYALYRQRLPVVEFFW